MAVIAKLYDIQSICINVFNKRRRSEREINCQDKVLEKEALLKKSEKELAEQKRRVEKLLDSASWRVTRPLRRAYDIMLKLRSQSRV
jgi:hypothetical protein